MVLIHGAMDRMRSFSRMARYLTEFGFDCVTYDRRGYEDSVLAEPFSSLSPPNIDDHVDDLAQIIGQQPAIVFGHSLGGTIALLLAEQNRAPISALVTFESPLPWMDFWPKFGAYAIEPGTQITDQYARDFAKQFMVRMIGEKRWERLPLSTRNRRLDEGVILVAEMASASTPRLVPDPKKIQVPTIVARGQNAPNRHILALDYLKTSIPVAIGVVVDDTDHGIHLTNPKAAASLIETAYRKFAS